MPILSEVIRQGEARMQAQLTAALAADARAGTLASVQAGGAAALLVFAAGDAASETAAVGAMAAAACLAVGACLAALALRPCDFGWVGSRPCDWVEGGVVSYTVPGAMAETCQHLDKYLRLNERTMVRNNRFAHGAVVALALAPFVGLGAILALMYYCG